MNLLVGGLSPSQRFWRFFTAGTISDTGTAVTAVALPLIAVITLQASPVEVGLLYPPPPTPLGWYSGSPPG